METQEWLKAYARLYDIFGSHYNSVQTILQKDNIWYTHENSEKSNIIRGLFQKISSKIMAREKFLLQSLQQMGADCRIKTIALSVLGR